MDLGTRAKPTWWRWPLLPLGAVGGALAGSIAIAFVMWLGMKFQGGFSTDGCKLAADHSKRGGSLQPRPSC
jgi:hypothetical protein